MHNWPKFSQGLGLLVIAIPALGVVTQARAQDWKQYERPEEAGFDPAKLEEARTLAQKARSTAVFVVYRGQVLAAWGQIDRPMELYSVRKSMVSALYGVFVGSGKIDTGKTIGELGIDDLQPLTETEKRAKIVDLLSARSGIYHPAAKEPADMKRERPARGSHAPGEYFWYNNWDFNVLGVLLEQMTGQKLFEAFGQRLAEPLGMQDYRVEDGFEQLEPRSSKHPAHAFRMSARDLARIGQLYLKKGQWGDSVIIPESWIGESTKSHSTVQDAGYGYMWWTYPASAIGGPDLARVDGYAKFAARGTGGQFMLVIPEIELVYVHLADTDFGSEVRGPLIWRIIEAVLAARTGEPVEKPSLGPLGPVAFKTSLPEPTKLIAMKLDPKEFERFVGEYEGEAGMFVAVYRWQDRLFAELRGEGESELFAESPTVFFTIAGNARVRFQINASDQVEGAEVQFRGQTKVLKKTK